MTPRSLILVVAVAGVLRAGSGCRAPATDSEMAVAESTLASFGPGRSRLDFRSLPPIPFDEREWTDPPVTSESMAALAGVLAGGSRIWLVGVGDGVPALEHGRQQGLARAIAVRRILMRAGHPGARILVTGVAEDEAHGLTGTTSSGPRVECAVVR